mgnify:FL=1|tara:strand:- start:683 stop:862 length:180 start_codon:yes stop_codon:yes gene_type:complete
MQKTVEEMIVDIIDNQAKMVNLIGLLNNRLEVLEGTKTAEKPMDRLISVKELSDEIRPD